MKSSVLARADSNMRSESQSHGHDKTVVVIGVFPDEIDSPRRPKNRRLAWESHTIHAPR